MTFSAGSNPTATQLNELLSSLNLPGRNFVRNGCMSIQQRGSSAVTTNGAYSLDGWINNNTTATLSITPQTLTLGDISGSSKSYLQAVAVGSASAGAFAYVSQRIEDVRRLAGKTVQISTHAKANTGTPTIAFEVVQNFGTGGSPSSAVTGTGVAQQITTTWTRYEDIEITIPSISGKTIGTDENSYTELRIWLTSGSTYATEAASIGNQSFTLSLYGVQLEVGDASTPFELLPIAAQEAWCRRYFWRIVAATSKYLANGYAYSTTKANCVIHFPTSPMRTTPTVSYSSVGHFAVLNGSGAAVTATGIALGGASANMTGFDITVASGLTAGQGTTLYSQNASATLDLTAEL